MQKTHIIGLVMIAAAIGVLIAMMGDFTRYADFGEAIQTGSRVKVVGVLSKDKPMEYDPQKDPNYFSFFMKDEDGKEHKVVLKSSKPTDFEMSEQIVVTGTYKTDRFIADDILLKCPSKYKDEELNLRKQEEKI